MISWKKLEQMIELQTLNMQDLGKEEDLKIKFINWLIVDSPPSGMLFPSFLLCLFLVASLYILMFLFAFFPGVPTVIRSISFIFCWFIVIRSMYFPC